MSFWASSPEDRPGKIHEALLMLYAQGIIDGLEVKPHEEKPYKVKIPSGIFHMDEDQAAMFSLGAVVAAFGPIARKGR